MALEEASEQPTSMQIAVKGACPPGLVPRWLSPPGLNSLWACGHVGDITLQTDRSLTGAVHETVRL